MADKDDERFKNLALFHFYGTDKELEEFAPVGCLIAVIIFIIVVIVLLVKSCNS
jgi:hypothetical protein